MVIQRSESIFYLFVIRFDSVYLCLRVRFTFSIIFNKMFTENNKQV